MSKLSIISNILIFIILSAIVICDIHADNGSTLTDYIFGLGSLASIYGILITLYQLHLVKKSTEDYQNQVKNEVSTAQLKIKRGLTISTVESAIKYLSDAIHNVQKEQYELAKIRMEDGEVLLVEILNTGDYFESNELDKYKDAFAKYKESLYTIQKNLKNPSQIVSSVVIDRLSKMRTELINVKSNIKKTLYG